MRRTDLCVGHSPLHYGYGLLCEEFAELVCRAEGRCERCHAELRRPVIEHDHALGRHAVRGLTCSKCNSIISAVERFERDPDLLTTTYLARPFHQSIPPSVPGLRPLSPRDRPRPRLDPQIRVGRSQGVINVEQAAEILGVPPDEVRRRVAQGQLISSSGRFRRVVVERMAAAARPAPAAS